MSMHGHTAATPDSHTPGHASIATYVRVALILTAVTALEVGVIYIRFLTPIIVPLLLVMAIAKFALVVMFFMHLRYDPRSLTGLFVGPLIIATLLGLALIALIGTLLTLHR
jgi:cytochrome c oxidase subunit 4